MGAFSAMTVTVKPEWLMQESKGREGTSIQESKKAGCSKE